MSEDSRFSRRELLKRAGLAGTAAVIPAPLVSAASAAPAGTPVGEDVAVDPQGAAPPRREAFETLTAAESETLEAITARLIPADALGPGAAQARAAHYIDRALAGPLAASRAAYTTGLAALNTYAQSTKGAGFAKLGPTDQDAVLTDLERNTATGFTPGAAAFFNLVRGHTIEGTFTDPYYGGNADCIGWDLIRYPGVRVSVTASEQQLGPIKPNHRSAYDFPMFGKAGQAGRAGQVGQVGRVGQVGQVGQVGMHEEHERGD